MRYRGLIMPINQRTKGQRGEYAVRDLLRKHSGLNWERVPASGALAYLKGDIFISDKQSDFLIEIKNYEESHFSDKILTNKSNNILAWWTKAIEQAAFKNQKPLVIYKYNRSKFFVLTDIEPKNTDRYFYMKWLNCYMMMLEEWLESEDIQWVKTSET